MTYDLISFPASQIIAKLVLLYLHRLEILIVHEYDLKVNKIINLNKYNEQVIKVLSNWRYC
jgi:hypothetical protein